MKTVDDTLRATAFDLWPEAALVLNAAGVVVSVNVAAEELFGQSLNLLGKKPVAATLAPGSRLAALIERGRAQAATVRERAVDVTLLGFPSFIADVAVAPFLDDGLLVTLRVRSATFGVDRNADPAGLHSVMGLGQMLAHEVKNPLAGIRGAAQLLKRGVRADDIPLAELIVDETDRIKRLIDRMEAFGGDDPPRRSAVNIHRVLDRVRALAANGVAGDLFLSEHYDPSLPDAWGEEDQLIQVFLNLTKNAAEAAHARGDGRGEIVISTAYRHGVKIRGADGGMIGGAPLEVKVADNGGGVPAKHPRSPVRALRQLQGPGRRSRSGAGRQGRGRPRRHDRFRIGARPHRVPRPAADGSGGGALARIGHGPTDPEDPDRRRRRVDPPRAVPGLFASRLRRPRDRQRLDPAEVGDRRRRRSRDHRCRHARRERVRRAAAHPQAASEAPRHRDERAEHPADRDQRRRGRGVRLHVPKPFDLDEMAELARRALAKPADKDVVKAQAMATRDERLPLIGRSAPMQEVYRTISRLVGADLTVLISGESGSGKELVARALHDLGRRRDGRFVAMNLAAIPRGRVDSELFGESANDVGRLAEADGGTLFLDEIGDMPLDAQTRLLRVFDGADPVINPKTGRKPNVRVIAATNRDLRALIAQGLFREDLYFRLNVAPIRVPPLRERTEDIPELARAFLLRASREGLPSKTIDQPALDRLKLHDWPGNVRELENLIRRVCALYGEETIGARIIERELAKQAPDAIDRRAGHPVGPGGAQSRELFRRPARRDSAGRALRPGACRRRTPAVPAHPRGDERQPDARRRGARPEPQHPAQAPERPRHRPRQALAVITPLVVFDEIDSTNAEARRRAEAGEEAARCG